MIEAGDRDSILSESEAICALLPYAIFLEQSGQRGMVNTIVRAARASQTHFFMDPINPCIATLFEKRSSPSLNRVIALVSPHLRWENNGRGKKMVVRWAAAASAVLDTEEIGQSVVDTLLQIAFVDSLRQRVPIEAWAWMNKRPSLPPVCRGRCLGTTPSVVRYVRGLGNFEILKSYLLLVWSEWDCVYLDGLEEMMILTEEEFGGIGRMWGHREDLIKRLDHILGQLDRGSDYLARHNVWLDDILIDLAKRDYQRLKGVLVEMDRKTLTRAFPLKLISGRSTHALGCVQNPTQLLVVHYLFCARDFTFGKLSTYHSPEFTH